MFRTAALLLISFTLFCSNAGAQEPGKGELAPLYEGSHVLPLLHLPKRPADFRWSDGFMRDTSIVLYHRGWYLAEVVCLLDESGQVRDTFVTESMPSPNLSATLVNELREKKFSAGVGADGAVPALYAFRIRYQLDQYMKHLGNIAGRLRRQAAAGDPAAQYTLSRAMFANVGFNREGLDADELLRKAADPGGNSRAMLALSFMTSEFPADKDPAAVVAERRGWQLRAAQAGSTSGQVLVALDSWAEQTAAGRARARHWLERAVKAKDPSAPKYLAALLVSHSDSAADWKTARNLARSAVKEWHGKEDPDLWQVLAAASALTGDFPAALDAQSTALALAGEAGWALEPFARRHASYRDLREVKEEIVVIPVVARVVTAAEPPGGR